MYNAVSIESALIAFVKLNWSTKTWKCRLSKNRLRLKKYHNSRIKSNKVPTYFYRCSLLSWRLRCDPECIECSTNDIWKEALLSVYRQIFHFVEHHLTTSQSDSIFFYLVDAVESLAWKNVYLTKISNMSKVSWENGVLLFWMKQVRKLVSLGAYCMLGILDNP